MPIVSVIIPFYSHKDWLTEALESVFSQTLNDIEVILVNDGSKEDISDLLMRYGDKLIYIEQDNKGPAAARNKGLSVATGEYVAFEDADDIWYPNKLEKQIAFMKKIDAVWCHTGFYYWWPERNKYKLVDTSRDYGDIYLQRFVSVKMATPCVVIKKCILDKENIVFPENLRNGEDGALFTQIAKNHPVALISEPLAKIRMRGANSNTHAIERIRLQADEYLSIKNNQLKVGKIILFIKKIYYYESKLLKGDITQTKETIAKLLWAFPFIIERIYVRYLAKHVHKDDRFILR